MGPELMVVRPMTGEDVAEAAGLERAHQPAPWSERLFREEMEAPNRRYLVARVGSDLAGYAGVMVAGEEAHVTNLLVAPAHRRAGLGTRLLAAAVSEAVRMGAKHLTLEVRAANHAARGLYTSFGLAPVGVRKGYYGDEDALIMWAHDIDLAGGRP